MTGKLTEHERLVRDYTATFVELQRGTNDAIYYLRRLQEKYGDDEHKDELKKRRKAIKEVLNGYAARLNDVIKELK